MLAFWILKIFQKEEKLYFTKQNTSFLPKVLFHKKLISKSMSIIFWSKSNSIFALTHFRVDDAVWQHRIFLVTLILTGLFLNDVVNQRIFWLSQWKFLKVNFHRESEKMFSSKIKTDFQINLIFVMLIARYMLTYQFYTLSSYSSELKNIFSIHTRQCR